MTITFTVLGKPTGKARHRTGRFNTYIPEKTVLYENLIKTEYRRQCNDYRFGDRDALQMFVRAEYPIPASTSKVKRAAMIKGEIRPIIRPDYDNIGKVVSDALNKIAYRDDSQIVDSIIRKYYSECPKITVKIGRAE